MDADPRSQAVDRGAADRRSRALDRTALGWQRSGLSLAVIAALLLLHGVHRGESWAVVAACVVGAGAVWTAMAGRKLYQRRLAEPLGGPAGRPLFGLVVVTLGAAALAAAELLGSG
jgi:uncharacterized membrane protein YidH (DUF202 family)